MLAWYDILTVVILLYATARGAQKGIVWQLAGIAALVLCFAFADPASLALKPYIGLAPPLDRWVSLLICYLFFSFISFGIARAFRDWIDKQRFNEYDRHVGAVFGLIKGATFSLLLTFFLVTLWEGGREPVFSSVSGRTAARVLDELHPVMPDELHAVLEPWLIRFDPNHMQKFPHDHMRGDGHDEDAVADEHDHDHATPTAGKSLEQIVRDLAGSLDVKLQQQILNSLQRTNPADREELIDRLRVGIPELMQRIADDWQFGKPTSPETPAGPSRAELLNEISGIFSEWPPTRAAIVADVEASLKGVPEHVAVKVLEDWHADLMETDPDPDPETGFSTPLDARIGRQLQSAGLPVQRPR